jgi:DNA-binding MarR family transcriptional regulator
VQATDDTGGETAVDLTQQLLGLWLHLMRGTGRGLFALVDDLELSITQVKTLNVLDHCTEEITVKELSEELHLSLPAASRLAEALLRRGFVERREDEHDRRMKRIRITDGGRRIVAQFHAARLEGLEQFISTLSEEQRRRLSDALSDLPIGVTTQGPCP